MSNRSIARRKNAVFIGLAALGVLSFGLVSLRRPTAIEVSPGQRALDASDCAVCQAKAARACAADGASCACSRGIAEALLDAGRALDAVDTLKK